MNIEIGVLFDIDGLGGPSSYGTPSWRILMKNLDLRQMPGVLVYQGDLDIQASQRPYCFCIAISEFTELTGGSSSRYFTEKMSAATDAGLFPLGKRIIEGSGVTRGLVGSGRVDIDGRFRMSSQLGDFGDLRLVANGREFGWRVLPDEDSLATFALAYLAKTGGEGLPLGAESQQLCESVLRDVGERPTVTALGAAGLPADRLKTACDRLIRQVWADSPQQAMPETKTAAKAKSGAMPEEGIQFFPDKKWWQFWK